MPRSTDVISTNIKRLREESGWSQDEVAERAGLLPQSYSRVERGDSDDVLLGTLEKIAAAFDVSVFDLLDGIDST